MSKMNNILGALGHVNSHETETDKKPLCQKTTKATLQSALEDEDEKGQSTPQEMG